MENSDLTEAAENRPRAPIYCPALRYGWELESELEAGAAKAEGKTRIGWEKAMLVVQDAAHRL